jgi:hypothetical protein
MWLLGRSVARRVPEYEKRRNTRISAWAVILLLCIVAWNSERLSYWGPPMMFWGLYELFVVPTRCRAITRSYGLCRNWSWGRLKGCRGQPSHGPGKREDLFRALTGGQPQPMPARGTRSSRGQSTPVPETVTMEPAQRLVIAFTVVGGIAGIIQTALAAVSIA